MAVKMRLQFTGWLQYMLPVPVMLVLFFLAGITNLLGGAPVAKLFALVGLLVLALFVFDLITVKFRLVFISAPVKATLSEGNTRSG